MASWRKRPLPPPASRPLSRRTPVPSPGPMTADLDQGSSLYASEDFQSLSAAAREFDVLRRSGQWGRLIALAARRRRAIWRGLRAVRRLRELELPLTSTPPGEAIWRTVHSRPTRVARAVLQLPDDKAEYRRGRSRQALRTNVRHAEALGIACRELQDILEKDAALDQLLRNLGHPETSAERRYLEEAIGLETGLSGCTRPSTNRATSSPSPCSRSTCAARAWCSCTRWPADWARRHATRSRSRHQRPHRPASQLSARGRYRPAGARPAVLPAATWLRDLQRPSSPGGVRPGRLDRPSRSCFSRAAMADEIRGHAPAP